MKTFLEDNGLILMEAAVVERLRRSGKVVLHEQLVNAPLIYDPIGGEALAAIYQNYVDIAVESDHPIFLTTPTWRANRERVTAADAPDSINVDAVHFMRGFQRRQGDQAGRIKLGGLIGCKNDCYKPLEGLSVSEAKDFHSWQVEQLVEGGIDFLIAETLPSVDEALGIAKAMEVTSAPYIISFVIARDGRVLDGTRLVDAVERIDAATILKPLGYTVSCAYPSFLCADVQPRKLFTRLIGYQANASSLDHCQLDGTSALQMEPVADWGGHMIDLHLKHGMKIFGGCCGTGAEHLRFIALHGADAVCGRECSTLA